MKLNHFVLLFIFIFLTFGALLAQDNTQSCKVKLKNLVGTFTGECKNGFANGNGDAAGLDHYIGSFKNGLPNGKGTYYYNDSTYYSGNFKMG